MTYLQIDHVNAVMADRMREADHARLVREARLVEQGQQGAEAKTAAAFPPSPRPAQGLNAAELAATQQPSKGEGTVRIGSRLGEGAGGMPVYMGGDGPYLSPIGSQPRHIRAKRSVEKGRPEQPVVGVKGEAIGHAGHIVHSPVHLTGVGNGG